jgi:hypothetical protein
MSTAAEHRSERHAALDVQDFADTFPTRTPYLYGSPEEVRRTGFGVCTSDACRSGRRACPTPQACFLSDEDLAKIAGPPRMPRWRRPLLTSAGRFWLTYLALLALCTALGLKWAGVL